MTKKIFESQILAARNDQTHGLYRGRWRAGCNSAILRAAMNHCRLASSVLLSVLSLLVAAPAASADLAYDEMAACAGLGPKPPGSAAGRAQAVRIAEQFRTAGLETSFERFHVPTYVVRSASIKVLGDGGGPVPGETFAYGGSGKARGEVVDLGTGRPEDYVGRDVGGKIVMVERNEAFHRSSQLNQVIAHGGAAMLYISDSPSNLIQTGAVRFAQNLPSPIPAMTVGAADGAKLRERMSNGGLRMRLRTDAGRYDAIARNVIGIRRGTTYPDKMIVVGGHYDTWHDGASDNCTGVGSLVHIARQLEGAPLAYTVVFAAWDAEEVGLTGSYDWVMRHRAQLGDVVVNENLETTAANAGAPALRFGTTSPAMNAVALVAGTTNGYTAVPVPAVAIRQVSGGIIPTDLQPFYSAGVQGFSTYTSTPYYHTTQDTADKVDRASLTRVSDYLADALVGLQALGPGTLTLREVPDVRVDAPANAAPGAAIPLRIRITDAAGLPLAGEKVKVLVNQNDHWPLAEAIAEEQGGGIYNYTIPAGITDRGKTWITATLNRAADIAEDYAVVRQARGGILRGQSRGCTDKRLLRFVVVAPRGSGELNRVTASSTAGRVRVRDARVRLSLRGVRRDTVSVKVTARTTRSGSLIQSRQIRPCVTERRLRAAARAY